MKTPSHGGALYFLLFIDDYCRYIHIYFLQKKLDVFQHFIQYKSLVENHTGKKSSFSVLTMGASLFSKHFNQFCADNGIQRQLTNPYNPAQNGVSERKNCALVESASLKYVIYS